ncbi:S24 family peptidase [Zooshikella sp. RANM57]|uniref:S24 family peptidase n=1 Tax=Zooshikella sp. RANM57 TaxID=3425863 RepID=UPI003D6EEB61
MKTLGQRLRERRKELKLTQKQVGKYAGVSAVSVTLWEKDETAPTGEKLLRTAKLLQCSPEWLLYEEGSLGQPVEGMPISSILRVPVISQKDGSTTEDWRETVANIGGNAFAVRVVGDSMVNPIGYPSLPEGSIAIIDVDASASTGDIIAVKVEESGEIIVKKLAKDGPHLYLMPLNPSYKAIEMNEHYKVLGVVKRVEADL